MTKSKKMIIGTLPFVALIVLFAIFCGIVSSKGYRLDMYIKIVFNEGIVLSIVATGAIFIYTLGSFDAKNCRGYKGCDKNSRPERKPQLSSGCKFRVFVA